MEKKLKHLELIQGVVNRLSTNSFLLKGWSVVLVSALFALSAPKADVNFIFLAYFPAFIFWGLDAYFLWQERMFRDLYNKVREQRPEEIDFSMDAKSASDETWWCAFKSLTISLFHGVLVGAIVIVMFIII